MPNIKIESSDIKELNYTVKKELGTNVFVEKGSNPSQVNLGVYVPKLIKDKLSGTSKLTFLQFKDLCVVDIIKRDSDTFIKLPEFNEIISVLTMKAEKAKIIRPDKIIAKDLTLRESADELFKVLNSSKENKIIVDFSKIEFMSRAFADEYLNEKQKTTKSITEKNLKTNVKKMLSIVKDSRKHKRILSFPNIHPIHLSSTSKCNFCPNGKVFK